MACVATSSQLRPTTIPAVPTTGPAADDPDAPIGFSYGGGKIARELLTLHYGGFRGLETVLFRPHNFIGPDMGFEHDSEITTHRRMSNGLELKDLPIQGDGSETRSFCDITDGTAGPSWLVNPGERQHLPRDRRRGVDQASGGDHRRRDGGQDHRCGR